MRKVKVIFRKYDGEIIAFLPQISVGYGNIMSYMHNGQHCEASLEFYSATKVASPEEYNYLLNELRQVYYDCVLMVKRKLCAKKDLYKSWGVYKSWYK